jgi:hypothetical protein
MLKWQRVYSYPLKDRGGFSIVFLAEVSCVEVEYTLFVVVFTALFVWSFVKETEDN